MKVSIVVFDLDGPRFLVVVVFMRNVDYRRDDMCLHPIVMLTTTFVRQIVVVEIVGIVVNQTFDCISVKLKTCNSIHAP